MKKLTKFEAYFGAAVLAVQLVIMFTEIVSRYIFKYSFIWVEELARYLFIWFIFLGAGYGVSTHSHVTVDILVQRLPEKVARIVEAIATLVWIALAGWMTYLCSTFTNTIRLRGTISTAMHLPMWIVYLAMPIGFTLMTVRLIVLFIREIIGKKTAEEEHSAIEQLSANAGAYSEGEEK